MMVGNNKNINIFLNRNFYSSQNKKDSVIEGIEKQIKTVQEHISKISENKILSTEEKLHAQKDLRKQLDELNEQLMKRNMEIQKQEREKESQEQMEDQSIRDEYTENGSGEANLISLSSALKKVSGQNSMSTKMKGEARVLECEIKLDEGRGLDVANKKEKLSQINSRIKNINKEIQSTLKDVSHEIKKGSGQAKEDKKADDNKVEEKQTEKDSKTLNSTSKIDVHI